MPSSAWTTTLRPSRDDAELLERTRHARERAAERADGLHDVLQADALREQIVRRAERDEILERVRLAPVAHRARRDDLRLVEAAEPRGRETEELRHLARREDVGDRLAACFGGGGGVATAAPPRAFAGARRRFRVLDASAAGTERDVNDFAAAASCFLRSRASSSSACRSYESGHGQVLVTLLLSIKGA